MEALKNNENWGSDAWKCICRVRELCPLIQCITNYVSMDIMANTLLAAGASPAMIHALEEIPDFTPQVDGLCINIGTLTPQWITSMKTAAVKALESQKPWVLDPVAVGASKFRMDMCTELVRLNPTVIRGNASEILALAANSVAPSKGTDSSHISTDALEAAKDLACRTGAIVAVSGAVDLVTDGKRLLGVRNGVPLMQKITASGCAVTALIATLVAAHPSLPFEATAFALALFGMAGEIGMEKSNGPASLRMHLIDALHGLDEESVASRIKISWL
ncbi:hydroxyethylthiazole kinase [Cryptomeria japonica]|uniref:hydroxyethylthiazole kinase n=1 Tax=Cryptomeria japonica TaxID=3369 RepID=UPI0027DA0F9A|nr:hydroxyethylthiazole kinase [Cryptomeria japonica]